LQEVEALYRQLDLNNDKRISVEEVHKALVSVNRKTSLKDAKAMVEQVDKNKNGFIDKSEFISMVLPKLREDYLSA